MRIHPGPPLHRRAQRAGSRAGRSIADRRTDIAEAGGAEPPRRSILLAPVAQCIEHRASNAEVAGENPAGSTILFPGVAQQQRHSAQNGASAGANPAAGTTLAPVAQRRGSGLKPRSVSVRIRPGALFSLRDDRTNQPGRRDTFAALLAALPKWSQVFPPLHRLGERILASVSHRRGGYSFCPRSPTAETSASRTDQCECNSRRGHQWNVNRTSEPGLFAKEIVAHFA